MWHEICTSSQRKVAAKNGLPDDYVPPNLNSDPDVLVKQLQELKEKNLEATKAPTATTTPAPLAPPTNTKKSGTVLDFVAKIFSSEDNNKKSNKNPTTSKPLIKNDNNTNSFEKKTRNATFQSKETHFGSQIRYAYVKIRNSTEPKTTCD